ncbi:MAG: hypothetical protein M3Y67_10605 [Pseudomonadota bacterium]|nr:hypothetical protein [Pseudomonadota bacterium]
MKALTLNVDEERAFATSALALRYGERSEGQPPAPITAEQLIEARRPEDLGTACGRRSSACRRTPCAVANLAAARRGDASALGKSAASTAA